MCIRCFASAVKRVFIATNPIADSEGTHPLFVLDRLNHKATSRHSGITVVSFLVTCPKIRHTKRYNRFG